MIYCEVESEMIGKNPMAFGILLGLGGIFVLFTWWGDKTGFGVFGMGMGFFSLAIGLWNIMEAGKKKE